MSKQKINRWFDLLELLLGSLSLLHIPQIIANLRKLNHSNHYSQHFCLIWAIWLDKRT